MKMIAVLGVTMAIVGVGAAMASPPQIKASAKYHEIPICVVAGSTDDCDCQPGKARLTCLKEVKIEIAPPASEIGGRSYVSVVAERDDGVGMALNRHGQWIDFQKASPLEYSYAFDPVASRHAVSLPLPSRDVLAQFCTSLPEEPPRRVDLYVGYGAVDPRLMKTTKKRETMMQEVPMAYANISQAEIKTATENGYLASARANANRDRGNRIVKVLSFSC